MERIEITNVSKFYGKKQALKNINLTIDRGMFGLLGRNGAGKTTLMKILATLTKKDRGEIIICGENIQNAKEIRKLTGYLPQDFSMYPNMSVYEALDYLGTLSGMSKEWRKKRIEEELVKVNLADSRKKKIKELSGGMKRRLGIAQAILHDPKILIVDEPTAGLDPEERIRFRNLLSDAAKDRIVILSTHIAGDIESSCNNIAVLNEGSVLWNGTISDFLSYAKGKVYTVEVMNEKADYIKSRYVVTGKITQDNFTTMRFISENIPDIAGCKSVSPDCEDAYMYLLSKEEK